MNRMLETLSALPSAGRNAVNCDDRCGGSSSAEYWHKLKSGCRSILIGQDELRFLHQHLCIDRSSATNGVLTSVTIKTTSAISIAFNRYVRCQSVRPDLWCRECPPCPQARPECRSYRAIPPASLSSCRHVGDDRALEFEQLVQAKLDLPTLGLPTIARCTPSRKNRPERTVSASSFNLFRAG